MRRVRNIIKIDEDLCNGCGECILSCAEGALAIIDGKAKLVGEMLCDGAGACLGHCPTGAMTIEQREADDFDEAAVATQATPVTTSTATAPPPPAPAPMHGGCPGAAARNFAPRAASAAVSAAPNTQDARSWLGNWPVQLHLVPVVAPHYAGATLLLCADCVPFAYPGFHSDMLAGRTLIIGCPKLDDGQAYLEKLTQIFANNDIAAIEVAFMEVPCCFGMVHLTKQALAACGKQLPARAVKVGIGGELLGMTGLN